jgi:hypothetical protein
MKRLIFMLFLALIFLLIMNSCNSNFSLPRSSTTPSVTTKIPTAIPTSSGSTSQRTSEAISYVAMNYYQAIAKQNYDLAYTYLDPTATKLSRVSFTQEALSQDKEEGKLQSYTAATFPPMVVMTNMRVHLGPYHVHLQFTQEGTSWKIVSLDRI